MDSRPVVWDATNVRHIGRDHPERGITRAEVTEALTDADRIETSEVRGEGTYHLAVGRTAKERLLVVVWVDHPDGRFPIHARPAERPAGRRYYRSRCRGSGWIL